MLRNATMALADAFPRPLLGAGAMLLTVSALAPAALPLSALHAFNALILLLWGGVLGAWIVGGTLATAQDGLPLGTHYRSMSVPLALLAASALLMPVFQDLTVLQTWVGH